MTDFQLLAVSVTVLAVFAGTIFTRVRIGDSEELIRAELRAEFASVRLDVASRLDLIDGKLDKLLRIR